MQNKIKIEAIPILIHSNIFEMNIYIQQRLILLLMLISTYLVSQAQDANLVKQLKQSNYLEYTMKADSADAGITRWLKKPAEKSRILPLATDFKSLKHTG